MKIFVTGGSGFVGKHLVKRLQQEGHSVIVLDIIDPAIKGAEYRKADITDYSAVLKAMEGGADVVYHLAAQISLPFSVQKPLKDFELNALGTLNLLEACRVLNVGKFILVSTAAIYGKPEKNPVSEDAPKRPDTPYGMSKLTAESYVRLYHRLYGMAYTILRFFNLYGPGGKGVVPLFVNKAINKEALTLMGSGEQIRDFLYIEDALDALKMALYGLENDEFNVGFGKETTIKDVAEEVKRQTGAEITYKKQEVGDELYPIADISKIKLEGFTPSVGLSEGIKRIIKIVGG